MQRPAETDDLLGLLAWYREMGAADAIGDAPIDWTVRGVTAPGAGVLAALAATVDAQSAPQPPAQSPAQPPIRSPAPPPAAAIQSPSPTTARTARPAEPSRPLSPPRAFPSTPPDASHNAARSAAASARSLVDLQQALTSFDGCSLKATAKNLCLYRGAEKARVMLIGEAPGREEDLEGKPFVGPAGQLLDRMLGAIGLDETTVHITNVVYWRPPGNRTPTPQEATVCRPFLERQIALVAPDIIVPLGGAAAKHILDVAEGIMRIRGRWHSVQLGGHAARAIATLHPAYLLRTPAAKRQAWRDLLTIKSELNKA